jgi:protein involved in polysaccharide export with SLBB domain
MKRKNQFLWVLGTLAFGFLCHVHAAAAEEYSLGPRDKIRLKAFEWRATVDQVIEWKALNDEFTVGANGMVSIPVAGEVKAAGLNVDELAKSIAEQLRTAMGVGRAPHLAVEIVAFRPFYVVGDVERPGEYAYRPGLTVLKAVSIAGGLRRGPDAVRFVRDAISTRGDLNVLGAQTISLVARQSRFQAELNHAEAIAFPNELASMALEPAAAVAMQQERQIFEARREALATQRQALNQLKGYLEQEIVSLEAQLKTEDVQIALVKKELQSISGLVERGLSAAPRQLLLERTIAQIEGDRLRVGAALLKARQEISKTDIALLELKNNRANEAARELREVQSKLDEVRRKAATSKRLLQETEGVASSSADSKVQPIYAIVRESMPDGFEQQALESTVVGPGDTIKIEVPTAPDLGTALGPSAQTGASEQSSIASRSPLEPALSPQTRQRN